MIIIKKGYFKTIVLIFITILLLISIVFLTIKYLNVDNTNNLSEPTSLPEVGNQEKPEETKELSGIKIELADYRVFKIDGVPFNFVIAKIRVKSSTNSNISLEHFISDEGIKLNEVSEYVNKLEGKSYFLGRQNVVFDLISNDTTFFANIFIPILNKTANKLDVNISFDDQKLSFDLNSHLADPELLIYKADDIITDGKTYQMSVSSAFDITGDTMSQTISGVTSEYLLPSTVQVYAFNLETVSLWGDIIEIEDAQYITNDNNIFDALDSSIQSMKFSNIIGKKITDKDKGSLFFIAYNPIDNPVTYKGVLKLKVKGSDNWIVVDVDLN
ncbi:MAG: hypothetical protein GX675_00990 [Erysipelotrichaceae bacterium]|nr:hypothetical protein [Erysipelotrichaceae bacterium]